jgi:hypothetical protein
VNFTGTRESIDEAKRLISEKIGDQQQPPSQQQQYQQSSNGATAAGGPAVGNYGPTEESERLIIPANKVGLVIGKGLSHA